MCEVGVSFWVVRTFDVHCSFPHFPFFLSIFTPYTSGDGRMSAQPGLWRRPHSCFALVCMTHMGLSWICKPKRLVLEKTYLLLFSSFLTSSSSALVIISFASPYVLLPFALIPSLAMRRRNAFLLPLIHLLFSFQLDSATALAAARFENPRAPCLDLESFLRIELMLSLLFLISVPLVSVIDRKSVV